MSYDANRDPKSGVDVSSGEHHAATVPAPRARQGAMLGRIRYVLGIGIALAVIAFAIIYVTNF